MTEKIFAVPCGDIHYWTSETIDPQKRTLVLLPGLTADHRLFDRQIDLFAGKMNLFTWDAPGHSASRPFRMEFTLADKAKWLCAIFQREGIEKPVLVGQSMGGYVGQMLLQLYPDALSGFVSIDSAPLQKRYMKNWEIWMLKHCEGIYRIYPWKLLVDNGAKGTAATRYGQNLMREMMRMYEGDPAEYARLVGHGYRMLAEAVEADLPYAIPCPALLLCGDRDMAGETKKLNRAWTKTSGIPLVWIEGAGHNANTDRPDLVNAQIERFVRTLPHL